MVEARIDLPKNYDPDMDGPIEFVRMCASGAPGAAALRLQALETCKTLRQRHSDEPAVYHLSGLVCYINDNEEAALRFWGQALHCIPNYDLARRALEEHLAADGHWSGVSAYMSRISQGENVVSDEYIELVRQHFDAGDLVQADYYAQRASAYNRPEVSKLRDIRTCREEASRLAEAGNLAACYDDVVAKFEALWAEAGEPMIDAGHTEWRTMPNRIQMADIVANVVDLVEESNPVIFELGCFAGFNLAMAAERARAMDWPGTQ